MLEDTRFSLEADVVSGELSIIGKFQEFYPEDNDFTKRQESFKYVCEQLGCNFSETLDSYAKLARPFISKRTLDLINNFLQEKSKYGSKKEQDLYNHMTTNQFIYRLITKRAMCFVNAGDTFSLMEDVIITNEDLQNYLDGKSIQEKDKFLDHHFVVINSVRMTIRMAFNLYGQIHLRKGELYNVDTFDAIYYDTDNSQEYHITSETNIGELVPKKNKLEGLSEEQISIYKNTIFLDNPFPVELLPIDKYTTYQEKQIAALIGISSPSLFINDGGRNNGGVLCEDLHFFAPQGYVIGQVGARFEVPGAMEYQHMLITQQQNTLEHGYGFVDDSKKPQALKSYWAHFYSISHFPTYQEVQCLVATGNDSNYVEIAQQNGNPVFLNVLVYKARMKVSIESFLCEANNIASLEGAQAYVHAVGLGIGVWAKNASLQTMLILEVYSEVLSEQKFNNIADIDFSYFEKAEKFNGANIPKIAGILPWNKDALLPYGDLYFNQTDGHKINIHFSYNNPQGCPSKLVSAEGKPKLLIVQYAWDSGSCPGNEYWKGSLRVSGDPAQMCCSSLEVQSIANPYLMEAKIQCYVSAAEFCCYSQLLEFDLEFNYEKEKKPIVTSEWVDFDDCQPPSSCDAESFGLFLLYDDSVPVCVPVDDEVIACSESLAEAKFSESDSEEDGMLRREFSMMPPSTEQPTEQQNFKPKLIKPRLF